MFDRNPLKKYVHEGDNHLKKGDIMKAKECYLNALSIEPNNVVVLNNLSQIYKLLNDDAKSISYNEILLEECNKQLLYEESEKLLALKSNALLELGKDEEANEVFDKILEMNPKNLIFLFQKAQYLELAGNYTEAIGYLDKILEEHEHEISVLLAKGRNLTYLKDYNQAEIYFNLVFEISPKNKAALNLKSKLLKEKNEWKLTPHDLMLKALEYWEMDDFKKAEAYFDKALDMDSSYDEIWWGKGELLIRMGKISDSINCFEKAFDLNPSSGGVVNKKELFRLLNIFKKINTLLGFEDKKES